jgi:TRAP-type uncharacterized transport system substrate-binding protein
MAVDKTLGLTRTQAFFMESFGLSRGASLGAILFVGLVIVFAIFWFFHSAPPGTLTITSGPAGSIFRMNAEKYRDILARSGVKLKILSSEGSRENLERLVNPAFSVDIGFVQGGVAEGINIDRVVSLGSISHEPLLVFYRNERPVGMLSQLKGGRLAIGPAGSGTRSLVLTLLSLNGIEPGGTTALVDLEAEEAAKALTEGSVDAIFLMADSASAQTMRELLFTPRVDLLNFTQADAYTRRIAYLNRQVLPQGSLDFGKNIPRSDVSLIGPTVELVARPNLHPALSDLLLETATEVHGKAGLLKRQGEFPAPLEHEYRISADAKRFYKSGRSFFYRFLPFWMAILVNRIIVAFVPMVVLLIPVLRVAPALYRWRMRSRIYRWYRVLLVLEKDVTADGRTEGRKELLERLDLIEKEVNKMKVPASFGDQFYVLREHIRFVHNRLTDITDSTHSH